MRDGGTDGGAARSKINISDSAPVLATTEEPLDKVAGNEIPNTASPITREIAQKGEGASLPAGEGRYERSSVAEERRQPEPTSYRATFTSIPGRFELAENRRFKQVAFRFAERPDEDTIDQLKSAGFKYRSEEKAWTIPASAATREQARTMAFRMHVRAGGTVEPELGR